MLTLGFNLVTTLWSVQTKEAWEKLQTTGVLVGDWDLISFEGFRPSYMWMIEQMKKRGLDTKGLPPIWAWELFEPPDHRKPYLEYTSYFDQPTEAVILEIQSPRTGFLVSDFDLWHAVLNNFPIGKNNKECDDLIAEKNPSRIQSTWERIFDIGYGDPDFWGDPSTRSTQATLPLLTLDMIKSAEKFTSVI